MLFRDSVWYPNTPESVVVITLLVGMTALHHTGLLGLTDAGLLFGWLPVQYAYDLGYTVLAVVLLYWVYTLSPDVSAERDRTATADAAPSEGSDR